MPIFLALFFLENGLIMYVIRDRGSTVVKVLCYKLEGRWFDPSWCHWKFSLTKSFRSHYSPGVDSASNRSEYQEHLLGGKGGRCIGLITLPPSRAVVMKSGNFNFLEPFGPLQACNGTALPLPFTIGMRGAVLQIGRSLVRSQLVSLEVFIDIKSF